MNEKRTIVDRIHKIHNEVLLLCRYGGKNSAQTCSGIFQRGQMMRFAVLLQINCEGQQTVGEVFGRQPVMTSESGRFVYASHLIEEGTAISSHPFKIWMYADCINVFGTVRWAQTQILPEIHSGGKDGEF